MSRRSIAEIGISDQPLVHFMITGKEVYDYIETLIETQHCPCFPLEPYGPVSIRHYSCISVKCTHIMHCQRIFASIKAMNAGENILVSGIKPTGQVHIANYFGAIRQFVELQDKYESRIFVADYHALTTVNDAGALREATRNIVCDYLAVGLDPEKVALYVQSDIPEVTELNWILSCLTSVPFLQRAHAYKDAEAKGKELNAGVFSYPVLMAADILIHDAAVVPVGADQKQHVEIARDLAERFNNTFDATFHLPEPLILEDTATVPGIDGQKMSKSYNNTIPLFADDNMIRDAISRIATDSRGIDEPKDVENDTVYQLHQLFTKGDELTTVKEGYEKGGLSYKESKDMLFASMQTFIAPLREKREAIAADTDYIDDVITQGAERVRPDVRRKMELVRRNVGLI